MPTSTSSEPVQTSSAAGESDDGSCPRAAPVTARDVRAAQARLAGAVAFTPCVPAPVLGTELGVRLFLKRDDRQVTGSFKERGAAHALLRLSPGERRAGVVAASAGNHALGLARHGPRCGVRVTLVMPRNAARVKVARCRGLGAEVVLAGESFGDSERFARALAARTGARYVHPFDDPEVIAGQGTLGLEVLAQVPDCDAIIVPVGGGGLLAGVALAVKEARPEVRIIAAEPAAAPKLSAACAHGRPVDVAVAATFADGLAVSRIGAHAFVALRGRVDEVVAVTEAEIAQAMLRLFEVERVSVEGAGAVALAALLAGKVRGLRGRTVVVPVCGANVDAQTFASALQLAVA